MSSRPGYGFYRDVFGGWRWEYYDRNGDAIDSRDAFETRDECVENARAAGLWPTLVEMPAREPQGLPPGASDVNEQSAPQQQTKRAA